MDDRNLLDLLLRQFANGRLDQAQVLLAIRALLGESAAPPGSQLELLRALEGRDHPAFLALRNRLRQVRFEQARRLHQSMASGRPVTREDTADLQDLPLGAPMGWRSQQEAIEALASVLGQLRDLEAVRRLARPTPALAAHIGGAIESQLARLRTLPWPWHHRLLASPDQLFAACRRAAGDASALLAAIDAVAAWHGATRARPVAAPDTAADWHGGVADSIEQARLDALVRGLGAAEDLPTRRRWLDLALSWPSDRVRPLLLQLGEQPWAEEAVCLALTLRLGALGHDSWSSWRQILLAQIEALEATARDSAKELLARPLGLLWLWARLQPELDPGALAVLGEAAIAESAATLPDADELLARWERALDPEETGRLLGLAPVAAAPPVPVEPTGHAPLPMPGVAPSAPDAAAALRSEAARRLAGAAPAASVWPPPTPPAPPVPPAPPAPPARPRWHDHLRRLLVENWYLAAGIVMIVAGSSLLAYYTWDKHWLVRYTIMPLLLAGFTAGLASLGSWLERRDRDLSGTAALLRAAAIGLLPVNCMTLALLARDPQVATAAVPLVGAGYALLAGLALRRWCAAVHPGLGWPLAGTLLLLVLLVALPPVASALGADGPRVLLALGAGFHVGFACAAWCLLHLWRRVIDRPLALEGRVPWFVGGTLAVTWLEAFAWTHGTLGVLPAAHVYAPLVIATGYLLLRIERQTLVLRAEPVRHQVESFIGFALVLLGVVMGANQPGTRVLCFALAGAAWLRQASWRPGPAHVWIGLTLLALSGASLSLLEGMPPAWIPAPGLGMALLCAVVLARLHRTGPGDAARDEAGRALAAMQGTLLVLTVVVTVLAQWRHGSEPLAAAGWLLACAGLLAANAGRRLGWMHTAMGVLAMSLPYLGCVDLSGRTLHGNHLVAGLAGLSWLWILWCGLRPGSLARRARSTVLWGYGALAVAGMALRVWLEDGRSGSPLDDALDLGGPLLMAGALAVAAYTSRSLLPAAMAALIVVVLFPELKSVLHERTGLTWGSGLGSALAALVLVLGAFALRAWPRLAALGDGDRLPDGGRFPLRREDSTLFTWPLLASALFLVLKLETVGLARHLPDPSLKACAGLAVSGAVWMLLAVFQRAQAGAVALVHIGWLWLSIGIACAYWRASDAPHWSWVVLLPALAMQVLYLAAVTLGTRRPWTVPLLAAPTVALLRGISVVATVPVLVALLRGDDPWSVAWLLAFLGIQSAWHGLATRRLLHGWCLVALLGTATCAWSAPRDTVPLLALGLALHLAAALAGRHGAWLRPLLVPALGAGALVAVGVALFEALLIPGRAPNPAQQLLPLALLLAVARANASAPFALLACVLAYLSLTPSVQPVGYDLDILLSPWRLAAWALAVAALAPLARWLGVRVPGWAVDSPAIPWLRAPATPWFALSAAGVALVAGLAHSASSAWRLDAHQAAAPYVAGLAIAIAAWAMRAAWLALPAVLVVVLGDIQLVRLLVGDLLVARGVDQVHLACLGLGLALLQASALRRLEALAPLRRASDVLCLILAGAVLALLSVNYLAEPDLQRMSSLRFVVSGGLALLAALYFRAAARRPETDQRYAAACESGYHAGLAVAIWCAALLPPPLRHPATALIALALPMLYFLLNAEFGSALRRPRYVGSATVVGFAILAMYVFRSALQMVIFPEIPPRTAQYHHDAPVVFAVGLLLLRLQGLGGGAWLGFYGGLAVMTATYFLLTWLPGLSPFTHPLPAAWCALGLGHFCIVACTRRSALSSGIQALTGIDGPGWLALRRSWGDCLLAAAMAASAWGVLHHAEDPHQVAPLLLGAASVLVHIGWLRGAIVHHLVAAVLVWLALHADFAVPSLLDRRAVGWVVLGAWAALCAVAHSGAWRADWRSGPPALACALTVALHVAYHRPWTPIGLGLAAGCALLAAVTPLSGATAPRLGRAAGDGAGRAAALALLAVPAWFAWWSQFVPGAALRFQPWPTLCLAAALLATGVAARLFHDRLAAAYALAARPRPLLADHLLQWLGVHGRGVLRLALWLALPLGLLVQASHRHHAFPHRDLLLLLALHGVAMVAWYRDGRERSSMLGQVLAELSALALIAALRHQLLLAGGWWTPEHDVWAGLALSVLVVAAKQWLPHDQRSVQLPLLVTLLMIPVGAMLWTLENGLGSDVALLVIGLHSVLFAWLGRERRDSPYHLIAMAGFVAFVLLAFHSRLELRVLHAYVIPVGVAVLILVQMFGPGMSAGARNLVRLGALLAMLGSAGYHALVDPRHPLLFNGTLLVLCLLAMGLGGFLRQRLHLLVGFAGLLLTLASILVKVMQASERGTRMTVIGSLVLVAGAALVGGAIAYKINRQAINARIDAWRDRLRAWE